MNKLLFDELRLRTSLLLAAVVTLAACNRNAETPVASNAAAQQSSVSQAAPDPFPSMAKAVYLSKAEQPVALRFELSATPQAAKPVALKLNLLGLLDATALQLKVSSTPDLAILSGAQADYAALKQGESWTPSLELRSKANGLYVLDVELQLTTETGPHSFKYAIPVAITKPEASSSSVAASR